LTLNTILVGYDKLKTITVCNGMKAIIVRSDDVGKDVAFICVHKDGRA
jgi:hypothetical protein